MSKQAKDFDAAERAVIRERARCESAKELAAVFGTTPREIGNIARYG